MSERPFMATWTDEIMPLQESLTIEELETTEQPENMPADGYHWLAYDSPSGSLGLPVVVDGEHFYIPGSATAYLVERALTQGNGRFTPLSPIGAPP